MFKIFKTPIPKENAQLVSVLQSWTLNWKIQGDTYGSVKVFNKCFIKKDEALEFEKQLKECAKFLGAWVDTSIKEN